MAVLRQKLAFASLVVCLVLAACGANLSATHTQAHQTPSGPIASNLPPGVCAPTYQQLEDPNATRIEAKLVARNALMKSDPDFDPTWHTDTTYFWVVASLGQFNVDIDVPMPPNATPPILHNALSLLQANTVRTDPESVANPCRGIYTLASPGTSWPRWFDQMTALIDVKIR